MNGKKLLSVLTLAAIMCVAAGPSFAGDYPGCSLSEKQCDKDGDKKYSMEEKVFKSARFFMKKKEELDLSDEQVKKIKDLKLAAKKDLITKKAEIEIAALDIKAALWEDPIDAQKVKELIDTKYEIKKKKMQNLASSYIQLKSVLTDQQKSKATELWKKKHAEGKGKWK